MDLAVRRERLANKLLGKIGPIGIGGVDEIDAEVGQSTQRLQSLGAIGGRPPDPLAHDPHRAKAKAIDIKRAGNAKAAGFSGVGHGFSPEVFAERAQGQLASGGIEDKIEATLPPVFKPKIVPRS